jgi:hypothetical protein
VSATILDPLRFELRRAEVLRLLGYGPRARPPAPRVERLIDETIREATEIIDAKGAFAIVDLPRTPARGPFKGAEKIGYGVATIGERLPARVAELGSGGNHLKALILDAVGSAAAEAAADVVNAALCERAEQKRIFTSRRISPGYPAWPIEAQKEIFRILPSRLHGVELREAYFMSPRKSVSFGVSIGRRVRHSKVTSICSYCRLLTCKFRRTN